MHAEALEGAEDEDRGEAQVEGIMDRAAIKGAGEDDKETGVQDHRITVQEMAEVTPGRRIMDRETAAVWAHKETLA